MRLSVSGEFGAEIARLCCVPGKDSVSRTCSSYVLSSSESGGSSGFSVVFVSSCVEISLEVSVWTGILRCRPGVRVGG